MSAIINTADSNVSASVAIYHTNNATNRRKFLSLSCPVGVSLCILNFTVSHISSCMAVKFSSMKILPSMIPQKHRKNMTALTIPENILNFRCYVFIIAQLDTPVNKKRHCCRFLFSLRPADVLLSFAELLEHIRVNIEPDMLSHIAQLRCRHQRRVVQGTEGIGNASLQRRTLHNFFFAAKACLPELFNVFDQLLSILNKRTTIHIYYPIYLTGRLESGVCLPSNCIILFSQYNVKQRFLLRQVQR